MIPNYILTVGLQNESERISSFDKEIEIGKKKKKFCWEFSKKLAIRFAKEGFYYSPTLKCRNRIKCFLCGKTEVASDTTYDMCGIHLDRGINAEQCPYSTIYRYLKSFRASLKGESYRFQKGLQKDEVSYVFDDPARFWPRIVEMLRLPAAIARPHSIESKELRLATFPKIWKFENKENTRWSSQNLALSGFFYSPQKPNDDRVICMYCGCELVAWNTNGNPLEKHFYASSKAGKKDEYHLCYFLSTHEDQADIVERITAAEHEHISLEGMDAAPLGSTKSPKLSESPVEKIESSNLNNGMESLEHLSMSPQIVDLSEDEPNINATVEKSPSEFDAINNPLDKLPGRDTPFNRENQFERNVPSYVPRRKQPTSNKMGEFEAHTRVGETQNSNYSVDPKQKTKADASGNSETIDAKHKSDHVYWEKDSTNDPGLSRLTEATSRRVLSPPDDNSSNLQRRFPTVSPQHSEDGNVTVKSRDSLSEGNRHPKRSFKSKKLEFLSKYQLSNVDSGSAEIGINEVLKLPEEDPKIKVIQDANNVTPLAVQNISGKILGDENDKILPFIEKDIRVDRHYQGQSKRIATDQETEGIRKKQTTQKARSPVLENSSKDTLRIPTLAEISPSTKEPQSNEQIVFRGPRKIEISSDSQTKITIDIQKGGTVKIFETEEASTTLENLDDIDIFNASTHTLRTREEGSSEEGFFGRWRGFSTRFSQIRKDWCS